MSAAAKLIHPCRQQGMRTSNLEIAKSMLQKRIGLRFIQAVTGLHRETIEKLIDK